MAATKNKPPAVDALGREVERVQVAEAELRAKNMAQSKRLADSAAEIKALIANPGPPTKDRWPNCEYFDCHTRLDSHLPAATDAQRMAARAEVFAKADAHGFHIGPNRHGTPSLYCSKSCQQNDTNTLKGRVQPAKTAAPARLAAPVVTNTSGFQCCDRLTCEARITTSHDPVKATAILAAFTWMQGPHGIFCSDACAKEARADLASGGDTKTTLAAKKSKPAAKIESVEDRLARITRPAATTPAQQGDHRA